MRNEKIEKIDGKDIVVKELETAYVCKLFDSNSGIDMLVGLMTSNSRNVREVMLQSLEVSQEEFDTLTKNINSYTKLEQAFYEVNADFFAFLPTKLDNLLRLGETAGRRLGLSLKSPASLSAKGT